MLSRVCLTWCTPSSIRTRAVVADSLVTEMDRITLSLSTTISIRQRSRGFHQCWQTMSTVNDSASRPPMGFVHVSGYGLGYTRTGQGPRCLRRLVPFLRHSIVMRTSIRPRRKRTPVFTEMQDFQEMMSCCEMRMLTQRDINLYQKKKKEKKKGSRQDHSRARDEKFPSGRWDMVGTVRHLKS